MSDMYGPPTYEEYQARLQPPTPTDTFESRLDRIKRWAEEQKKKKEEARRQELANSMIGPTLPPTTPISSTETTGVTNTIQVEDWSTKPYQAPTEDDEEEDRARPTPTTQRYEFRPYAPITPPQAPEPPSAWKMPSFAKAWDTAKDYLEESPLGNVIERFPSYMATGPAMVPLRVTADLFLPQIMDGLLGEDTGQKARDLADIFRLPTTSERKEFIQDQPGYRYQMGLIEERQAGRKKDATPWGRGLGNLGHGILDTLTTQDAINASLYLTPIDELMMQSIVPEPQLKMAEAGWKWAGSKMPGQNTGGRMPWQNEDGSWMSLMEIAAPIGGTAVDVLQGDFINGPTGWKQLGDFVKSDYFSRMSANTEARALINRVAKEDPETAKKMELAIVNSTSGTALETAQAILEHDSIIDELEQRAQNAWMRYTQTGSTTDALEAAKLGDELRLEKRRSAYDIVNENMNPLAQLAAEIGFDPTMMNAFDVGILGYRGTMAVGRRATNPVYRALLKSGGRLPKGVDEAEEVVAASLNTPIVEYANEVLKQGLEDAPDFLRTLLANLGLGYNQKTTAHLTSQSTMQVANGIFGNITTVEDAKTVVSLLANDPLALLRGVPLDSPRWQAMGNALPPEWVGNPRLALSFPVWKDIEELVLELPTLADTAKGFNQSAFMLELFDVVDKSTRRMFGVPVREASKTILRIDKVAEVADDGTAQIPYVVREYTQKGAVVRESQPFTAKSNAIKVFEQWASEIGAEPMNVVDLATAIAKGILTDAWLGGVRVGANTINNAVGGTLAILGQGAYEVVPLAKKVDDVDRVFGTVPTLRAGEIALPSGILSEQGVHWTVLMGMKPNNPIARLSETLLNIPYGKYSIGPIPISEEPLWMTPFHRVSMDAMHDLVTGTLDNKIVPMLVNGGWDPGEAQRFADASKDLWSLGKDEMLSQMNRMGKQGVPSISLSSLGIHGSELTKEAREGLLEVINNFTTVEEAISKVNRIFDQELVRPVTAVGWNPPSIGNFKWSTRDDALDFTFILDQMLDAVRMSEVENAGEFTAKAQERVAGVQKLIEEGRQRLLKDLSTNGQPINFSHALETLGQYLDGLTNVRKTTDELGLTAIRTNTAKGWRTYYQEVDGLLQEFGGWVDGLFKRARETMVMPGEAPSKYSWDSLWSTFTRLDESDIEMLQSAGLNLRSATKESGLYRRVIDATRQRVDQHTLNLWSVLEQYPSTDALDMILHGMERVQIMGAQAAAYLKKVWADGSVSPEEYYKVRNQVWAAYPDAVKEYFDFIRYRIITNDVIEKNMPKLSWIDPNLGEITLYRPHWGGVWSAITDDGSVIRVVTPDSQFLERVRGNTLVIPDQVMKAWDTALSDAQDLAKRAGAMAGMGVKGTVQSVEKGAAELTEVTGEQINRIREVMSALGYPSAYVNQVTGRISTFDNAVLNKINKMLGTNLERMKDLTPEQVRTLTEEMTRAIQRSVPSMEELAELGYTIGDQVRTYLNVGEAKKAENLRKTLQGIADAFLPSFDEVSQSDFVKASKIARDMWMDGDNVMRQVTTTLSDGAKVVTDVVIGKAGKADEFLNAREAKIAAFNQYMETAVSNLGISAYKDQLLYWLIVLGHMPNNYFDIVMRHVNEIGGWRYAMDTGLLQQQMPDDVLQVWDMIFRSVPEGGERPLLDIISDQIDRLQELYPKTVVATVDNVVRKTGDLYDDVVTISSVSGTTRRLSRQTLDNLLVSVERLASDVGEVFDYGDLASKGEGIVNYFGKQISESVQQVADQIMDSVPKQVLSSYDASQIPTDLIARLEKARQTVVNAIPSLSKDILDAKKQVALQDAMETLAKEYETNKILAVQAGEREANQSMLDFNLGRGVDQYLKYLLAFPYYWSRSFSNWARRTMRKPWILADFVRTENAIARENEQAGLTGTGYEGTIPMPGPLARLTGRDRLQDFTWKWNFFGQIMPNSFNQPTDDMSAFEREWTRYKQFAPQPFPHIGFAIEAALDYWYPLEDGTKRTDQYNLANMLGPAYEIADQALQMMRGTVGEQNAWYRGTDEWQDYRTSDTASRVAFEMGYDTETAQSAQGVIYAMSEGAEDPYAEVPVAKREDVKAVVDAAIQIAGKENLFREIWGLVTGVRTYEVPEMYLPQREAARQYRDFGYSEENLYGSKAAQKALLDSELGGLIPSYWTRGGPNPYFGGPQESAQTGWKYGENQVIYEQMGRDTEEFIKSKNGDVSPKEVREFQQPYFDQLGEVEEKYPLAQNFDKSSKGMRPEEFAVFQIEGVLKSKMDGEPERPPEDASPEVWQKYYADYQRWQVADYAAKQAQLASLASMGEDAMGPWVGYLRRFMMGRFISQLDQQYKDRLKGDVEYTWRQHYDYGTEIKASEWKGRYDKVEEVLGPEMRQVMQEYYDLDKGEPREQASAADPRIRIANFIMFNGDEYDEMAKRFGPDWVITYYYAPNNNPYDRETQEEQYYQWQDENLLPYRVENPLYDHMKLYLYGRYGKLAPQEGTQIPSLDMGEDYADLISKFGPNIFEEDLARDVAYNEGRGLAFMKADDNRSTRLYGYTAWRNEYSNDPDYRPFRWDMEAMGFPSLDQYSGERPVGSGATPVVAGAPQPGLPWADRDLIQPWPPVGEEGGGLPGEQVDLGGGLITLPEPTGDVLLGPRATQGYEVPTIVTDKVTGDAVEIKIRPGSALELPALDSKEWDKLAPDMAKVIKYAQQNKSYVKWKRTEAAVAARRDFVVNHWGAETLPLWDHYFSLPKGDARKEYKNANPILKAALFSAYNPAEFSQAVELFGQDAIRAWAFAPAYDGSDEQNQARRDHWDAFPEAFLFNSWLNGRPRKIDESEPDDDFTYNFGKDYAKAQELFGKDIWSIVGQFKRGWDTETRKQFYNSYPQYVKWRDWWYDLLGNDRLYYTRYDNYWRGGYGYGGGGFGGYNYNNYGGGGADQPYRWVASRLPEAPSAWRPPGKLSVWS